MNVRIATRNDRSSNLTPIAQFNAIIGRIAEICDYNTASAKRPVAVKMPAAFEGQDINLSVRRAISEWARENGYLAITVRDDGFQSAQDFYATADQLEAIRAEFGGQIDIDEWEKREMEQAAKLREIPVFPR